jgi:hypothetical protein
MCLSTYASDKEELIACPPFRHAAGGRGGKTLRG